MATSRIELGKEPPFFMSDVAVEPARRQLNRRSGPQIIVEHRVMQVLIALVQADGAIITRDALTQLCWDGRVVGDDAINRVISRLRRAAEELGGDVFRIETISKVGYRLILIEAPTQDVEMQNGLAASPHASSSHAAVPPTAELLATGSATTPGVRQAVGRGTTFSSRRAKGLLAAALVLLMLAAAWLWHRQGPTVLHTTAVRLSGYRLLSAGLPATIRESINAEIIAAFSSDAVIGVSTLPSLPPGRAPAYSLGGTIYRVGDTIRVISRLTNERSGVVLWSGSADYAANRASEVPRKVAIDVGIVVRCGLSGAATYHKALPDPALSNYLQYCREYWSYGAGKTLHFARRVVGTVPDFSWGWSAVGNGYVQSISNESDGQRAEALRQAGLLAEAKALKLDPTNAEALAHKAYLIDQRDWAGQMALLKAAIAAKPLDCGCEHYGYGLKLQSVGRLNAAVEQFRAATNMLALWPDSQLALASALVATGQLDQAKLSFEVVSDLSNDPGIDEWVAMSEGVERGDYPTAVVALSSPQLQLSQKSREALLSAYRVLASGEPQGKEEAVEALIALPQDEKSSIVVRMLGALGANNAALQAAGERPWLFWRPSMRGVLNEPGFPAMLQRSGLVTYWRSSRTKPDVCFIKEEPPFCRMI